MVVVTGRARMMLAKTSGPMETLDRRISASTDQVRRKKLVHTQINVT